jgi:hypothetical protein
MEDGSKPAELTVRKVQFGNVAVFGRLFLNKERSLERSMLVEHRTGVLYAGFTAQRLRIAG